MSALMWFVSVLTFKCTLGSVLLGLFGLVTAQWYEGAGGYSVGLVSDCQPQALRVLGHTVRYCTLLTPDDLASRSEQVLAALLLASVVGGVGVCAWLCYECCSHSPRPVRTLLAASALAQAAVCVGFAASRQGTVPSDAQLGCSYAAVMAAAGLAMTGAVFSSCAFDVPRYREYIPLT